MNFKKKIAISIFASFVLVDNALAVSADDIDNAMGVITGITSAYQTANNAVNNSDPTKAYTDLAVAAGGTVGGVLDGLGKEVVDKGNLLLDKSKKMKELVQRAEKLLEKYPKTFKNNNKINKVSNLVAKFKNNANDSFRLAYKAQSKAQILKGAGKALGGAATVYGFVDKTKDFKKKLDQGTATKLDTMVYAKDALVSIVSVIPGVGSAVGFVDLGVDIAANVIDVQLDKGRNISQEQAEFFYLLKKNAQKRALKTIKEITLKKAKNYLKMRYIKYIKIHIV
jgi:hypothetical protein